MPLQKFYSVKNRKTFKVESSAVFLRKGYTECHSVSSL